MAYEAALEPLAAAHQRLAEETDLDLGRETRWVALWEMTGRCLALANALIDQLRRGWAPETVGTMRVLHEAANLLITFLGESDGTITRRWLSGGQVDPREARGGVEQYQQQAADIARAVGLELEGDVAELTRGIYKLLSKGAHNQRGGFPESIAREARMFNYGTHPDVRIRAVYVEYGGQLIEQIVMEVGHVLAQIIGRGFDDDAVKHAVAGIHAVRDALPIGAQVRAAYGYGGDHD